jgi:hypothetical protein
MASGTFTKTIATHYRIKGVWSSKSNTSGNYSDVTLNVYWESIDASINSSATKSGSSKIDGTNESFSFTAGLSVGQSKLVNTQTKRVYHNSDGKKSITFNISLGIAVTLSGTYYGTVSDSETVALDNIPRNSTLSSSPTWTNGETLPITIARSDSGFTHTVGIYIDNQLIRTEYSVGTSRTVTFTEDELKTMFTKQAGNELPSKIVIVTYDGNGNSLGGSTEAFGTLKVPNKSRVRELSTFTLGDPVEFTISRANTAFTANVGFYYDDPNGNPVYLEGLSDLEYGGTWTPSVEALQTIYKAYPNSKSVPIRFRARTYYKGIQVGSGWNDTTTTGTIAEGKPVLASTAIRYADTNTTTKTLTGDDKKFVGGKSQLTVYVDANPVAQNEAKMVSLIIQVDGKSVTKDLSTGATAVGSYVIGTLSNSQYQTLTIRAIDSRGLETQLTYNLTILQYSVPTANIFGARRNKFDAITDISVNGSFTELKIGTTPKNSIQSMQYRYKATTTTTWGSWNTLSWTTVGGTFVSTPTNVSLDNTLSYDLQVQVTDKAGSTTTANYVVGTGTPILFVDADKSSVGVGKFPTGQGTLEAKGDVDTGGNFNFGAITKAKLRYDGSKIYLDAPDNYNISFRVTSTGVDIGTNSPQLNITSKMVMGSGKNIDMASNDIVNIDLMDANELNVDKLSSTQHKFDNGYNWLGVRDGNTSNPTGMYIIQNKAITVPVSASTSGFLDMKFDTSFDTTPLWILAVPVNSQSLAYTASVYNTANDGCRIYVQNVNSVSATLNIQVQVVACGLKN